MAVDPGTAVPATMQAVVNHGPEDYRLEIGRAHV